MTAFASNTIMLIMAGIWAYLSVINKQIYPVPFEFIMIGLVLAGPEAVKTYKMIRGITP